MHVVRLALGRHIGRVGHRMRRQEQEQSSHAQPHPHPRWQRLIISGIDAVLTGVSTTYTVTATLSDGTTRAVSPTWTSSNTDVASVDSSGRLEGRAHGTTTLTATHDGISATKSVQVVNNYRGT